MALQCPSMLREARPGLLRQSSSVSNIVEAYASLHVRNSGLQRASTCYSAPSTPPRKVAHPSACSSCEDEKENIRLLRSGGALKKVVLESASRPAKGSQQVGSQTIFETKKSIRRPAPPSFHDTSIAPLTCSLSQLASAPTATSVANQSRLHIDTTNTTMLFDSDADKQTAFSGLRTAIRSKKAAEVSDLDARTGSPGSRSPKTLKSPRTISSPSPRRQKAPQWVMPQADPPEDVSLPKDSVLPPSSILRPTYRSQNENSTSSSPTKKLQRKQSTTRVRKDSGTSGHSRSFSLPRTISAPDYPSSTVTFQDVETDDAGRPAWLDCDPVEGIIEASRANTPSDTVLSSSVSLPLVAGDIGASQQERQSKRKPSFYKRKRSQTATNVAEAVSSSVTTRSDSAGFPMPSPLSEIVKAMPLGPVKAADTGLLSSISRKRSHPSLSAHQVEQPPPLPDAVDYFGKIEREPPKSAKSWLSFGSRVKQDAPLPPIPLHYTSDLSSPATKESSAFATSSPLSKGYGRSRSGSVTSLNGHTARSASISEPILISRNNVPVPPVPAMPSHMRGQSQAEVVISPIDAFRGTLQSPRKSPRILQSPTVHKRAPSAAPSSPSTALTGAKSPPASHTPLSPPKRSMSIHRPPASPSFRKPSRTGTSPGEEQEREAKFLELLTRSDKAENGVLKVSLTSKAAKNVGIA